MLEVFAKFICFVFMALSGFYVIKSIANEKISILDIRTIFLLLLLCLTSILLYSVNYTALYTITVFVLNIIIYKYIFKMTLEESIVSCGIFMVVLFLSDLAVSLIFRIFVSAQQIRTNAIISLAANCLIGIISIIIPNIEKIKRPLQKFYLNVVKSKKISSVIFFALLIIDFSYLAYNIINSNDYDMNYFINSIVMVIFIIVTYIFIKNRNSLDQLSDEYDNLFNYVQNFEEWIEKEQLNRHEYKNQLAVLRSITKEKKVKEKIDSILEDNINISDETINQLKDLPKGGMKGLIYYKSSIAEKQKVSLVIDVSLKKSNNLKKLTGTQMKILCKILGIYFDNAIEGATVTKDKKLLLEIYQIKKNLSIVISNTFIKTENFERRNEKNVSSKGKNRGKGLYFAKNLLNKNSKWISAAQEIIDNYYIQKINIKLDN